jgi:signal transduction histidine kinase
MKRQTVLIFYLLGIYVFLQFAWWGYHLIELTAELGKNPNQTSKRTLMVLGEGAVFFGILLLGLWKIRASILKEIQVTKNQNNFLLSITHELKTPIASTRLFLQTLKKHDLDEPKRIELLDKALMENTRLESLIDNILNATRLESKALTPVFETVNISDLVNDSIRRFEKQFPNCDVLASIKSDVYCRCDLFIMDAILSNLLDNALKYAGDNARIEVVLTSKNQTLCLSVSDNGNGIPEYDKASIFKKFYRSGNEETRAQKGSGLGLFIVSEFVRLHQGTIQLKEGPLGGAKFEVTLPL